jgi:tetraacyldisaccharide 4'-kinase
MSAPRRHATPAYWYDGASVPIGARLLSRLYGRVIALRRALYARGWKKRIHPGVPVLVVGNLVAGGTGKTPLTIAIVERLRAAGWNPGVATRGYGRRDETRPLWVDARTDPAQGGDEPVLVARRTGARVRADRDRVAAAQALVAEGCDVVVSDDGLQHYRLARDLEIEVLDARRRHGNGLLLPAGPLREPATRAAQCDFRVVNLGAAAAQADAVPDTGFGEWPMQLQAAQVLPLRGARTRPLSGFAGQRVHAVAGIGDPERFFGMLRNLGIGVVPHAFADHHAYTAQDLHFGSDLPVLMTEKDAVKCTAFANDRMYAVPIEARLPEAFWVALLDTLRQVREAQRQQP